MPTFRARTALACRIVRLDRQKFNDAVADGHYHCAPETRRGSTRLFTEDDMVGLYVFARLTDADMLPRRAGDLACEFKRMAERHPDEDRIVFLKGMSGMDCLKLGSDYDPDITAKGQQYAGVTPLAYTLAFHVGSIRAVIREAIDYERSIIGEDDE